MYIIFVTFDWTIALSPDNELFCTTSITNMAKRKSTKGKQRLTKYTHKIKDRVTPLKTGWTVVGGGGGGGGSELRLIVYVILLYILYSILLFLKACFDVAWVIYH